MILDGTYTQTERLLERPDEGTWHHTLPRNAIRSLWLCWLLIGRYTT